MIHQDFNNFPYYESLEEIKADGLTPIAVKSPIQFMTLVGKRTTLLKENLTPLECDYVILAKTAEYERYYLRKTRGWTVDEIYFNRRTLTFSGDDETIEGLHRYIYDDRTWLLYTPEMVEETKKMLARVLKGNINGEGKLKYTTFIDILERSIRLEDYKDIQKGITGFKTACHLQEEAIRDLFKSCIKK